MLHGPMLLGHQDWVPKNAHVEISAKISAGYNAFQPKKDQAMAQCRAGLGHGTQHGQRTALGIVIKALRCLIRLGR